LDENPFPRVEVGTMQGQRLQPKKAERRTPVRRGGGAGDHDQSGGREHRCGDTHTSRVPPSRRRLVTVSVCAFAVATALSASGCGTDEHTVDATRADRLVLRVDDLPRAFSEFDAGPIQRRDTPPGPREDPRRFEREGGWKARFRRSGGPQTKGPLVIESRVDVFERAAGAADELTAFRIQYEELLDEGGVRGRRLADPDLGGTSVAFALLQSGDPADVRYYVVAWQVENVTASLVVNGFEPRLSLAETLALARKQDRRIREQLPS
jgi:hypothetical protein